MLSQRISRGSFTKGLLVSLGIIVELVSAQAQNLQVISVQGGGQVVFGPFDGKGTAKEAMGVILKTVHTHLDGKPQLGRFFEDKVGKTVAVFFHLKPANGNKEVTGLAIVFAPTPTKRSAAVVFDSSDRFKNSFSTMMRSLAANWHPVGSGSPSHSSYVKMGPLQTLRFPDNSGSILMPDNWQVLYAHGGGVMLQGPNGEKAVFGQSANLFDPNYPGGRQYLNSVYSSGMGLPGNCAMAKHSDSPATTFISIRHQFAAKQHAPMQSITITSAKTLGTATPSVRVHLVGELDAHDGHGLMSMNAVIRFMNLNQNGSWAAFINQINVPEDLVSAERSSLLKISESYRVNSKTVIAEDNAFVAQLHASSKIRDKEIQESSDASEKTNDAFCNYIRGDSVILDNETGKQQTNSYDISDGLVRTHPNRYQYVPIQDYMKGVPF